MAKTFKNLLSPMLEIDNLHRAFKKCSKGRRNKPKVVKFRANLVDELLSIKDDILSGNYQVSGYNSFLVYEPKVRKITALKAFRDRVVQQAVFDILETIYEPRFIPNSFACRTGKGTHAALDKAQSLIKRHSECSKVFVFKADVRKFFASINHSHLKRILKKRIGDQKFLNLLYEIIDSYEDSNGCGLPIGNLTSQIFANIYLNELDQFVVHRRRVTSYIRYMDDFVVIGNSRERLKKLRIEVEQFLSDELSLSLNNKTEIHPISKNYGQGLSFLGCFIWKDRRRVKGDAIKRFNSRVKTMVKKFACWEIDHCQIKPVVVSMLNHFKTTESTKAIINILNKSVFIRDWSNENARRI